LRFFRESLPHSSDYITLDPRGRSVRSYTKLLRGCCCSVTPSIHRFHRRKAWRHPQNRKYI